MDVVFKLFDQITGKIPPRFLQMIRLGALLIWLIMATVVVFFAWQRGAMEAPQSGQDLSMATIREKITRAENLNKPPDITIPRINDLTPPVSDYEALPYERRPRAGRGLAAEDSELREPGPERGEVGNLPPYLGETRTPSTDQVFPRNTYKPARDPGVAGTRDKSESGQDIPVFDLRGEPGAAARPTNRPAAPRAANPATPVAQPVPRTEREPVGNQQAPLPGRGAQPQPSAPVVKPPAPARPAAPPARPAAPASSGGSGAGLDLLPVD